MKKNNKKKTTTYVTLLLLIAFLTIGYALLSTTLNINGTTILKGNTWNIHWANVQVTDGSTTGNTKEAIITSPTQVEFSISLDKPGDYYEFTVDAVNEGTIDGMIDVISTNVYQSNGTTPTTLPSAITYSVTYDDGIEIEQNHLLPANATDTYKVRVEYKRDISNSELLTSAATFVFKIRATYEQADENGTIRPMYGIIPYYNASGGCATVTTDSSGGGGNATMSGLTLMMKNASQGEDDPSWFTNTAEAQSQAGVYTRKGTSNDKYPIYYYRGKSGQVNNNLLFNDDCWKIIRTTATGGIRIIYNGPAYNSQCTYSTGSIAYLPFNNISNNPEYAKYVYNDSGTQTDSNIKIMLDRWYNTNMSNVDNKVEKSVYCNDTSEMSVEEKRSLNLTTTNIYFCPFKRAKSGTPTTLCSKKSDAYRLKVGFVTVDEEELAGRTWDNGMYDYLFNDEQYWTGSPGSFNGTYVFVYSVNKEKLKTSNNVDTILFIRPVITLLPNTSYTGTGTGANPFVVS